MKRFNIMRMILPVILFLFLISPAAAQPAGSYFYNAINAGTLNQYSTFSDTQNNDTYNGFGDDFGQISDDIFYVFTLNNSAEVNISHCYSAIDTYMYLLDVYGNIIVSNDDNGPLCSGLQASITAQLAAGTYYVVSEGYGSNSGYITTEISIDIPGPPGSTKANPIDAGTLVSGNTYTDTQNNSPVNGYGNDIGQPSDDIYYKFTLSNTAEVSLSHCGSAIDTYMYLLDTYGTILSVNDDNGPVCAGLQSSIKTQLSSGTYYVVSEGYGSNTGNITTTISIIDTTTLAGKYNYIFQALDRNQIPTGFIDERAFPLISLTPFNGLLTDSNKVDINTWRALYFTMRSASLLNVNPYLPIDSVNLRIAQHDSSSAVIPVTMLFSEYNAVKPYAFTNNLLSIVNDQVQDVPGRPETPYLDKALFAATPIRSEMADGNFSLVFKPELFFTNSNLLVSSLYVDFDDGQGYQSVSWNTGISPSYSTEGEKIIKIKAVLSNSSEYECYALLSVKNVYSLMSFNPNNPDLIQTFTPNGSHSGGRAIISYSSLNNTGHIKKPLIIVEGYDTFSIAPNLSQGNYSYEDFIASINATNQQGYDFNNELDDVAGYDLVFIDYNNGTDDIVRNAALLQEIIGWVNDEKALVSSTEQNVVMGISMGGLAARYALADMTKNSIATETRLLITHDSPHLGANVPVGLQQVVLALGEVDLLNTKIQEVFPEYDEAIDLLNAPATSQLLKYRVPQYGSPIQENTWIANQYRPMVTFTSSDPQPSYRFIATSQGAECGTPLFNPGSQLLNIEGDARAFIPIFLVSSKLKVKIKANALPALGSSAQLANVQFSAKIKIFGLITVQKDVFNYVSNVSSSSYLPLDGATGGTSPLGSINQSDQGDRGGIPFLISYKAELNTAVLNNFCFVPAASALDVQDFNDQSLTAVYINGMNPTNPSGAENFIAQEGPQGGTGNFNEVHTRFTARNAHWLYNEMENIPNNNLNCSSDCQISVEEMPISGASSICSSSTYSINNLPVSASVVWSASPSGKVTISGSGNSVTITPIGSSSGSVIITAVVNTICGTRTITKQIYLGAPVITPLNYTYNLNSYPLKKYSSVANNEVCDLFTTVEAFFDVQGSDISYVTPISITNPSAGWGQVGNSSFYFEFWDYNEINIFRVTASNECGTTTSDFAFYSYPCNSPYLVFPNPSDGVINVSIRDSDKSSSSISSLSTNENLSFDKIEIFDASGLKAHQQKFGNGIKQTSINISDLPNGVYFMHIYNKKKITKQKIVVQH